MCDIIEIYSMAIHSCIILFLLPVLFPLSSFALIFTFLKLNISPTKKKILLIYFRASMYLQCTNLACVYSYTCTFCFGLGGSQVGRGRGGRGGGGGDRGGRISSAPPTRDKGGGNQGQGQYRYVYTSSLNMKS